MREPAKTRILRRLHAENHEGGHPLAIHEFNLIGVSENAIGTRLPELAKLRLVEGRVREHAAYKEWVITGKGIIYLQDWMGCQPLTNKPKVNLILRSATFSEDQEASGLQDQGTI